MNTELNILDLYEANNKTKVFQDNINSTLKVNHLYEKQEANYEWLTLMEESMRYLQEILKNPNRFIVNEEEIVKIEQAKKITVESIRHLAKHTNMIQDINDKGEVKPSKVLNIFKEESYDTYENRLIFTLVENMKDFVVKKKRENKQIAGIKESKKIEYEGKCIFGNEKVNMFIKMESRINQNSLSAASQNKLIKRIEKLDQDIGILTSTDVYKMLQRKKVARVTPPVKKTNLILKNPNFQCAMKLWDFLQMNAEEEMKREKSKKAYEDESGLKRYIDESFVLDYLALNTIGKAVNNSSEQNEKSVSQITDKMIEKVIELNSNLSEEELINIVTSKILELRNSKKTNVKDIESIISNNINDYLKKIEGLEL